MKYLFGFLLFFLVGLTSVSGQGFFPAATIADSLRAGSEAVVRFHNTTYRRTSLDSYTETVHYAVTILNARGKHAARLFAFYDRNTEVKEISGIVFNALGLPDSKIKKKNIKDYAANPNYTLFSDHRVMTFSPAITGYPYTVEYKYTIEHKGVVGFSTWMPRRSFDISVEKACLEIETPANLGIRYMALNHDFIFTADTSGPVKRYNWSVEQMKALESGPALPHHLDYMPALFLTPLDISFEGTVGSFDNWSSYGKWVYGLIEGRDRLSEETVEKMRSLTDTIQDPHKKVRAVYQYMQGRTRYVNVALGIGGFQPLHAYEVDEKGYGDCKALSNYTKALLKSIGITSYYAEIGSGKSRELKYPDFASINQTNHIILCVPFEKDTTWLECTSQTIPFGFIGAGNSDRFALLITGEGGVLARTPVYRSHDNIRSSKTTIGFDENGNAAVSVNVDFYNAEYEDIDGLLHLSPKEQKESLLKYLTLEGFTIERYSLEERSDQTPRARISVEGTVSKMAGKAGGRLLLEPEFLFSQTVFRTISSKRKIDLYKPVGYHYTDTLTLTIPEGFRVEQLPEAVELKSEYGYYQIEYSANEERVNVIRELEVYSGTYDQGQFDDINAFFKGITRSDKKRIIICK